MINTELKLTNLAEINDYQGTREGFGMGLEEAARNEKVVVLCGDLEESMRLGEFIKRAPERMIEVGVAEQNMMGVAAGLALEGKIPFVTSFAVFSPGRNWDQLRVSVAYTRANVKVIGGHVGLGTGEDGATHQGLEDIAITRVLPEMVVMEPIDAEQARKMVRAMVDYKGPMYMRVTRLKTKVVTSVSSPFAVGKAQVLRLGNDLTIVGCGPVLVNALEVAEELSATLDIEVINMHTIKPIDSETLVKSARKTGRVMTIEDHQVEGGLGSAVAEVLGERQPTELRRLGVRNSFGESGSAESLLRKFGLDKNGIRSEILKFVEDGKK